MERSAVHSAHPDSGASLLSRLVLLSPIPTFLPHLRRNVQPINVLVSPHCPHPSDCSKSGRASRCRMNAAHPPTVPRGCRHCPQHLLSLRILQMDVEPLPCFASSIQTRGKIKLEYLLKLRIFRRHARDRELELAPQAHRRSRQRSRIRIQTCNCVCNCLNICLNSIALAARRRWL